MPALTEADTAAIVAALPPLGREIEGLGSLMPGNVLHAPGEQACHQVRARVRV